MNQKGFSIIAILLLIIVLAGVGLTGMYVYHAQKSSPEAAPAATSKDTAGSKAPTQSKLTIKEWGVTIPLTDSLQGANYDLPQEDNPDLIELYMPVDGKSQAATSCYGGASIQRITAARYDSGTWDSFKEMADASTKFWSVGNYYYMADSGDMACGGSQALYKKAAAASNALVQQAALMAATETTE